MHATAASGDLVKAHQSGHAMPADVVALVAKSTVDPRRSVVGEASMESPNVLK